MIVQAILFMLAVVSAFWFWRRAQAVGVAGRIFARISSMLLWIYAVSLLLALATSTHWFAPEIVPWWAMVPMLWFAVISTRRLRPRRPAHV